MAKSASSITTRVLAVILLTLGTIFTAGGSYLISLGGSFYYLTIGIVLLASGTLVWRHDRRGAWLYCVLLAWTLVWSLWEVGLSANGWAFVPRLVGPVVVGLFFLLPPVQRALFGDAAIHPKWVLALCLVIVASIAVLIGAFSTFDGQGSSNEMAAPALALSAGKDSDWPAYGRDPGGLRYSPLGDISPENIGKLKVAWTFHTGFTNEAGRTNFEVTPLKVGNSLYLCDGKRTIFSLDPDTGRVKWKFDPQSDLRGIPTLTCRGVTYYRVPDASPGSVCAERIYTSTLDAKLWALDALTGKPCNEFGTQGVIDLHRGIEPIVDGYHLTTSAPTIARGQIIVGNWFMNSRKGEETGIVRAYDAASGRFTWAWDLGQPGLAKEPEGNERYTQGPGSLNVWAPMSVDEKLGLVYMPTGTAFPDVWAGYRSPQVDKYSSSVVAIEAETGRVRWSFQTTHHDLWDYDVPSQPTLVDLPDGKGAVIPALIQSTKRAETFVLDRRTGHPIVPVREKPVPQGVAPGDHTSPTQPFSDFPSLGGPPLTEAMMWGITPLDQLWCRIKFRQADYRGTMTPPSTRPSISYPGYGGGAEWGGVSIDPQRMLMVMNVNRFAMYGGLIARAKVDEAARLAKSEKPEGQANLGQPIPNTPFSGEIFPFLSPLLIPCQQPPYGAIGVFDLKKRSVKWSRSFGSASYSGPLGLRSFLPIPLGIPNMGGALTTRSGITFIGATQDRRIRAIETETGRDLWSAALPAGGHATPMTYRSDRSGRQFIVIASGGGPLMQSGFSDTVTAFALPAGTPSGR